MTQGPSQDPANDSREPADAQSETSTQPPKEAVPVRDLDPQDDGSKRSETDDTPAGQVDAANDQPPSQDSDTRQRSLDALLDRLEQTEEKTTTDSEEEPEQTESGFEWIADSLDEDSANVDEPLPDDDHVLLLTPQRDRHADAACKSLATPVEPRNLNALFVSLNRTSEQLLDHWQTHEHELPAHIGIVPVGEQIRSSTTTNAGGADGFPSEISITPASDPSDLTRLGITVNKRLEEWADGGRRTTMCIDSLTTFLQYVEPERLFRFLHLLQSRVDRVDGVAHYHMNPTAHSKETVNIFATLVDTVVTVNSDGTITTTDY